MFPSIIIDENIFKPKKYKFCSRYLYTDKKTFFVKLEVGAVGAERKEFQCYNEYELWTKIEKKDKKFFSRLIKFCEKTIGEDCIRYTIHKYIHIYHPKRFSYAHQKIINTLIQKYDLGDIDASYVWNCGMNKTNGLPIIYDYGWRE